MSQQAFSSTTPLGPPQNDWKQAGQETAETAVNRGEDVARVATQDVRQLAETVKDEAAEVRSEVLSQARQLVRETSEQLQEQAESQTQRLANAIRRLGEEGYALTDGRPDGAPTISGYVRQAADRLEELAGNIESRGAQGVVDEVEDFARQKPAAFLLGAVIAGFGIGRLLRAGALADGQQSENNGHAVRSPRSRPLVAGAR